MQDHSVRSQSFHRKSFGVVTVTGQGVTLCVRRHQLEITDGFPLEAPHVTRTVTRATARMDRLLFLAGSGLVTVDALDFCGLENHIPIIAVTQSGALRWTLLPGQGGASHAILRRAQVLAPFTDTGLEIARWLVQHKIAAQRDVLDDLGGRASALKTVWPKCAVAEALTTLKAILAHVERAKTVPSLRQVEAEAADVYWSGWIGLPLHFAPPLHRRRVPPNWLSFVGRGSPLNNGNRNAADPVNAFLNYAYALLEAETLLAVHESGLDPYIDASGLHTDQDTRRSLVYSIMEPVRPIADRLVLNLILSHAFRPGELWSLRDSRCKLDQNLCAKLWPFMPTFHRALGPVMIFILNRLRRGPRYSERAAFRLVAVSSSVRTRAPLGQKRWTREARPPAISAAAVCHTCGVLLEGQSDRLYCDACLAPHRDKLASSVLKAGRETLNHLRSSGRDVAHGGTAARRRGAKVARANRERARWSRVIDGPVSLEAFRSEILPRLRRVPLSRIAHALGISRGYASFIRRGLRTPHPRLWDALQRLTTGARSRTETRGAL